MLSRRVDRASGVHGEGRLLLGVRSDAVSGDGARRGSDNTSIRVTGMARGAAGCQSAVLGATARTWGGGR